MNREVKIAVVKQYSWFTHGWPFKLMISKNRFIEQNNLKVFTKCNQIVLTENKISVSL